MVTERDLAEEISEWSVAVVARLVSLSQRHVLRLLRQHRDAFGPPQYRRIRHRWTRVLSGTEVRVLKSKIPRKTAPRA